MMDIVMLGLLAIGVLLIVIGVWNRRGVASADESIAASVVIAMGFCALGADALALIFLGIAKLVS